MKLVEISAEIGDLIISEEQSRPRSPGIHVSDVIKHIEGRKFDKTEEQLGNYSIMGRIWEQAVARALAAAKFKGDDYERPEPLEVDGIVGSPDAIGCREWAVNEYKATYLSSNRDVESLWGWWVQQRAYCYMIESRVSYLYAMFIVGDWKGSGPIPKAWRAEYTERELRENWLMILNNAKDMKREKKKLRQGGIAKSNSGKRLR